MTTATQKAQGTAAILAQEERQIAGIDKILALVGESLLAYFSLPWQSFVVKILKFFINIHSGLIVLRGSIIATALITFSAKKITILMPYLYDPFKPRVCDPKNIWKIFSLNQYEFETFESIIV
jgi:hypothetical protein